MMFGLIGLLVADFMFCSKAEVLQILCSCLVHIIDNAFSINSSEMIALQKGSL